MAELLNEKKRSAFYGWPMVIFLIGMLVFAIHACTHMVAAGDTWVAMACGRHHASHGVDTDEPFSANSHDVGPTEKSIKKWPPWAQKLAAPFDIETVRKWHPTGWVNQNWLTHTTFYWLAKTFGSEGQYNYNALVYWKFTIYIIEVICVYFIARLLGVSMPGSAVAASCALYVGRTFIDIRPAGYANLLSVIFLLILALSVYRNMRYIWLLVPVTVFWANVHGGYIYVFIMMVPFIGVHFLARLPKKYTLCLFCIGAWSFLYLLSYKFISHATYRRIYELSGNVFTSPPMFSDKVFRILTLLIVITVVMAVLKNIKPAVVYVYCLIASLVFGLLLLGRMSIALPGNIALHPMFKKMASDYLWGGQSSFYFFLLFLLFVGVAVTFRKKNLVIIKSKDIILSIAVVAVAFVAMVLFNPYHLTNLTHTFEISVSEHAESWRTVNEWHPAFEWDNRVGDEIPFLIMYIIGWIALVFWFGVRFIRPRIEVKRRGQVGEYAEGPYKWPRIDIAIIAIVVMSIYMAIRSRRFIPMAATAACPLIVLFFEQAVSMVLARARYKQTKKLEIPFVSPNWRNGVIAVSCIVVLSFGVVWGAKYKRIYLDPWVNDEVRDSVFIRMTASNVKPFDVTQFMRENKFSGRMFNYWTEGGALAFGQQPDAGTGKTPLQLFMDGRAQAAYSHNKFDEWREIYGGGDTKSMATKVRRGGKIANAEQMRKIGDYLTSLMEKDDIWVFVFPAKEYVINHKEPWAVSYFPVAMPRHPDWVVAYADNHQVLYVNKKMARGQEVYGKLLKGELKFPTEMSENFTLARHYLIDRDEGIRRRGFELAKRAFELEESSWTLMQLTNEAARWPELRKDVTEYIQSYMTEFEKNKAELFGQSGYLNKLSAAGIGSNYLSSIYKRANPALAAKYKQLQEELYKEGRTMKGKFVW